LCSSFNCRRFGLLNQQENSLALGETVSAFYALITGDVEALSNVFI
jgi:hypothetical protein